MATGSSLKNFAEQALRAEIELDKWRVPGSVGRVVYLLRLAGRHIEVTQQEFISATGLRKDAVSKLVKGLVMVGLLERERSTSNPRVKRLRLTDRGREFMSSLERAIHQPQQKGTAPTSKATLFDNQ